MPVLLLIFPSHVIPAASFYLTLTFHTLWAGSTCPCLRGAVGWALALQPLGARLEPQGRQALTGALPVSHSSTLLLHVPKLFIRSG